MTRHKEYRRLALTVAAMAALAQLFLNVAFAADPSPTRVDAPDGGGFLKPEPAGTHFPADVYGIEHGYRFDFVPATGDFGQPDASHGDFSLSINPFYPRSSEGIYFMDIWLEKQSLSGEWSAIAQNEFWLVATPNPGPSESFKKTWEGFSLQPDENYRIFCYVYMYNQGGGAQGKFVLYSTSSVFNTGSANQAPRVYFSTDHTHYNQPSVTIGNTVQLYVIGEDDNGDLTNIILTRRGRGQIASQSSSPTAAAGLLASDIADSLAPAVYDAVAVDSHGAVSSTATLAVTVVDRLDQQPVGAADVTLPFGVAFTPGYSGGSGFGGWQFAVAGYTNWDLGTSGSTGTLLEAWRPDWSPPAPGSYTFWVARDGDSNFKPSGPSAPYQVRVAGYPSATIAADRSSINLGDSAQISAGFTAGTYDSLAATNIDQPVGTPAGPGQDGSAQSARYFTFVPSAPGDYTFAARIATPFYPWATYATTTVHVGAASSVAIAPAFATLREGEAITLTASGGHNGYVWGGSATGSGDTQTVSFPSAGDYTVTAYSPAGGIFPQSNTATASLHILPPPSVAIVASPDHGSAPLTATVSWAATNFSSVTVSGPGLFASYGNGSQAVVLGTGTATYSIVADGAGGHASASTSVVVAAASGLIAATPAAVDFGGIFRDSLAGSPTTASQVVTLRNTGSGPVTLSSLALTGSDRFGVTSATLPLTLAPNASINATITAGPGLPPGGAQASLTAVSTSNTVVVPVAATGLAPILSITWTK